MENKLSICVAGWHYFPEFLDVLAKTKHRVHIIYRFDKADSFAGLALPEELMKFNVVSIPDEGLDFGAYSYYFDYIWDRKSNVLFCHDDAVVEKPEVFDEIAKLDNDALFIFENEKFANQNWGNSPLPVHGRCIFIHERILTRINHIWFDKENKWKKEGIFGDYVNEGVYRFLSQLKSVGADVGHGYCAQWKMGYRGSLDPTKILNGKPNF